MALRQSVAGETVVTAGLAVRIHPVVEESVLTLARPAHSYSIGGAITHSTGIRARPLASIARVVALLALCLLIIIIPRHTVASLG